MPPCRLCSRVGEGDVRRGPGSDNNSLRTSHNSGAMELHLLQLCNAIPGSDACGVTSLTLGGCPHEAAKVTPCYHRNHWHFKKIDGTRNIYDDAAPEPIPG